MNLSILHYTAFEMKINSFAKGKYKNQQKFIYQPRNLVAVIDWD